jgi:N-formylglutamate deformylase
LKKKSRLPILIIIPHGGQKVPDEVSGYETVSDFDLFMQSDSCANELFNFNDDVALTMHTDISRFFMDVDRPYMALPPHRDGVIKKTTLYGKPVFLDDLFPDEIAISNLLRRYYFPFHEAIDNIISAGRIEFILECHTMMPVGPNISPDPGKPRPIVMLENMVSKKEKIIKTCSNSVAAGLLECLEKSLFKEDATIAQKYAMGSEPAEGYIMKRLADVNIPILKLSVTRALFLNEEYFSTDYMRVDELRISHLKRLIWGAVEKFFYKNAG